MAGYACPGALNGGSSRMVSPNRARHPASVADCNARSGFGSTARRAQPAGEGGDRVGHVGIEYGHSLRRPVAPELARTQQADYWRSVGRSLSVQNIGDVLEGIDDAAVLFAQVGEAGDVARVNDGQL
jgi:hypothetical protein